MAATVLRNCKSDARTSRYTGSALMLIKAIGWDQLTFGDTVRPK